LVPPISPNKTHSGKVDIVVGTNSSAVDRQKYSTRHVTIRSAAATLPAG
jgi:hypothetical protein